MLVGTLVCDHCDRPLVIGYTSAKVNKKRNYRCQLGHISRSADKLETYLSELVIERLSRPDAHELLLTSDVLVLASLRDEAQQLRGRQSFLTVEFGKGTIPGPAYSAGMAEITARLEAVE